ncbi:MAG TPA: hypothetical protein VN924_29935 [Bryobacteraceae bacterium]|jgi:hypothetical protein|nr:hypothetical protein [Bryobacteraceae bacterium]
MTRRNQLLRVAKTLGLSLLPILLVCAVRTSAQDKPTVPQRGAVIDSARRTTETYSEILAKRRLTQKDGDMQEAFPRTPMGTALARIATLYPYGVRQDNVPEARLMSQDLAVLHTAPVQALADLRIGFRTLLEKYWAERQFLIQIAGRLAVPRETIVDFLTAEMSRPVKVSAGDAADLAYLSPAAAADVLMAVVPEPDQRDAAFRRALKAQPDGDVGRLVLSRYEAVDALHARSLAAQLDLLQR